MTLPELRNKIENREASLAVVGLGYVGLPVACMFARAGFHVIGLDIKLDLVSNINSGTCPIEGEEPGLADLLVDVLRSGHFHASSDYAELSQADVILIDVETPVDQDHAPDYDALKSACRSLGPVIKQGALVIIESTLAPGTTNQVVRPVLESSSGKRVNHDFFLGACPERVMPGKLLTNLRAMSRVCGGSTPETAELMIDLYKTIVEADLDATDPQTAELVKTTENAYRDVQIAFANEVAMICEATGGDVWRVRELVNKSPNRQMHLPGAGVGGHCIPKDPWLLAYAAHDKDIPLQLIPAARAINDSMPYHVVQLVKDAFIEAKREIHTATILVLGYAYLEEADDTRNSPSETLLLLLHEEGVNTRVHDPYVPEYRGDLLEMAEECDAVILMVRHKHYLQLNLTELKSHLRTPILVDGRGAYSPASIHSAGFIFRTIGHAVTPTP